MEPTAVEHAERRLVKAEKSLSALEAATNFDAAEEAWTDFLLAVAGIYSKLEQGAKSSGPSLGWFGRQKKLRRDDPLLRYLHYARNSDEHGIERVVSRFNQNGELWGKRPKFGERVPLKMQRIDDVTGQPAGDVHEAMFQGDTIKLIRVHDRRFGDFCDPPQTHLGNKISYYEEPFDIGRLALAHLKALIAEAATLARAARGS